MSALDPQILDIDFCLASQIITAKDVIRCVSNLNSKESKATIFIHDESPFYASFDKLTLDDLEVCVGVGPNYYIEFSALKLGRVLSKLEKIYGSVVADYFIKLVVQDFYEKHTDKQENLDEIALGCVSKPFNFYRCLGFSFTILDNTANKLELVAKIFGAVRLNEFGKHWATRKDKAECYWQRNNRFDVRFKCTVSQEAIDIGATLLVPLMWPSDVLYEMRLKPKSPITLTSIIFEDVAYPLNLDAIV